MTSLYDSLTWRDFDVPTYAAAGRVMVKLGTVDQQGPTITLVSGVHGDEGPWGALAIRKFLERPAAQLKARLQVILAANPLAAEADARNAPLDGLDLNRSFPGDSEGSHTAVLAAQLSSPIRDSDVVIDLHGGGSWCVNAFCFRFLGSEQLAHDIGAPFIVDVPDKAGTLTQLARAHGAKVVAVEMGGRSRDELRWRDRIAQGLERVLYSLGLLELSVPPPSPDLSREVGPSEVLRPRSGGIFVPSVREDKVGRIIAGGTELGRLVDLHTLDLLETFVAPHRETALLLLRPHICVLEGGAMTYVVAQPKEIA